MLGFHATLPISDEDRQWTDEGFGRLEKLLGRTRMLQAKVVVPTAEDFPDFYDKTAAGAERLFNRVCAYMQVSSARVQFEVFADQTEELREILPYWHVDEGQHAAGIYMDHGQDDDSSEEEKPIVVAIRSSQLKDPLALVATIAHELGHVILLGGRLLNAAATPDHEPMTDLLTVFLGLGVFTANFSARFMKYEDDRRQGWSMQRLGYLPEEVYGYALAKFAMERGEVAPDWAKYLSTNVRSYFKRSRRWLQKKRLLCNEQQRANPVSCFGNRRSNSVFLPNTKANTKARNKRETYLNSCLNPSFLIPDNCLNCFWLYRILGGPALWRH